MKKFLFLSLVLISQVAFSQGIKVLSNEEIPLSGSEGYFNPILSPAGDFMLVTSADLQGLLKYDFATKEITPITAEAGAGFDAQISSDGKTIVYRSREYKDRLRYTSLKSLDLETGKVTELVKPTRNLEGVAVKEGTVLSVDNGKLKSQRIAGRKLAVTPPVSSIKDGQLYVTTGNTTRLVVPFGEDAGYLWNSVSPDGTKLLFYVVNQGKAYITGLDGSNPVSLGTLRAAKWMGNDLVVGMLDFDDGHVVTSSKIIAVTADGAVRQELTDSSIIATYPMPAADGSKILYNTGDGKVYVMHIEIINN
jgi:Tol biopolymer transport system component